MPILGSSIRCLGMFSCFLYFMKYWVVVWSSNVLGCTASSTYDLSILRLAIQTRSFMHNRYGILFDVITAFLHTWTLHLICVVHHYDASSHDQCFITLSNLAFHFHYSSLWPWAFLHASTPVLSSNFQTSEMIPSVACENRLLQVLEQGCLVFEG